MKTIFKLFCASVIATILLTACGSDKDAADSEKEAESTEEQPAEQTTEEEDDTEEEAEAEEEEQPQEPEVNVDDLPPIPSSLEEAADYPLTGQFSGKKFSELEGVKEELDKFPALTEESSEEEIEYGKRLLVSLFKENMTMVDVPIDQWESMTFADPTGDSDELQPKENYNVALLLDASGSMANYEHDRTRMDLAKEAIQEFVENLPDSANVALYVYGHVGTGSDEDKEKSCSAIDEVYPLSNYDEGKFSDALDEFEPAGWTPMASAIKKVQEDFKDLNGEQNSNVIYIVSDGVETCDEDPVEAIKSLADSDISPVVNIIGYQVDNEGLKQLKEMAEASDGRYVNAGSQKDIIAEFEQTNDMAKLWADWHNDAQRNISELFNTISKQLSDWHNSEQKKLTRETNNLFKAIGYLRDQEIISHNIYSEFIAAVNDAKSGVQGDIIDTYKELNGMNIDELWENRKEITKRYKNR